jgi:replicative DNA helicase
MQRNTRTRKNQDVLQSVLSAELGKLPPQALDVEEVLLGSMLLDKDAVSAVIESLLPEHFYKEGHQMVYTAMVSLFNTGNPVDIITVVDQLRKDGNLEKAGGAFAVSELSNRVSSGANASYYAKVVIEKFLQRELIRLAGEIQRDAYEDSNDVLDLLDTAESKIFNLVERNIRKGSVGMTGLLKKAIEQIQKTRENEGGISGIPTGFVKLDQMTAGFQRGTLNIIAARPAMGKTAFVLSLARNVAVDFKKPVAVFSLEMGAVELVNRLISGEAEIPGDKLKKGTLEEYEWKQLNARIGKLAEAPIYIDDTPSLNMFQLRAAARRLRSQHQIEMIIIDYLQLMSGGSPTGDSKGNREQEIASISRGLKGLAKELDIPVLALSQLSRNVESRGGDKRPMLSDLRESGSIEQDADIVMFIYRPEYYGITEGTDGSDLRGVGKILIEKHRNGATGDVDLRFISHYAKFTNLETFSNFGQTITLGSKMNQMEEGGFGSKPAAGGPKFTPPTDDDGPKFGGPAPF